MTWPARLTECNGGVLALVGHRPVLVNEVVAALEPEDGAVYVDATFGAGGYTLALLEAANCTVFALDRDPSAVARAAELAQQFPGRLMVCEGRFGDLLYLLRSRKIERVDGIAFDLGVSSMQLDEPERGFSFRADGPLDMRMGGAGPSAAEIVNGFSESALADIIFDFGEERQARRVARAIVRARTQSPITTTARLADIVRAVVPASRDGIDPATRTFQALRIFVNDEMEELRRGLRAAEAVLPPGGRLAVVSFHSLEDREVKNFLRDRSGGAPRGSRHLPEAETAVPVPTFRPLFRGTITPSAAEIAINPRARSAKLRAAERTAAPASPPELGRPSRGSQGEGA